SSLAGEAAAIDVHPDIEPAPHIGQFKGSKDGSAVLVLGEEIVQLPSIDLDLAVALGDAHPGHGSLPSSGSEIPVFLRFRVSHGHTPVQDWTSSTWGCWAWWG